MPFSLLHAHGTAMVLAWMVFASTGILFARYGRSIRLGSRRQLLGKALWFQMHRFLLSLSPLFTLLGFFFILVFAHGQWIDPRSSDIRVFLHSVFGGIIVCGVIIQMWLALYRCHPHSRFRFIFDWSHRVIGFLTFLLSFPTIFLIVVLLPTYRTSLSIVMSLWIAWTVMIIIAFERIERQQKRSAHDTSRVADATQVANHGNAAVGDTESGSNINGENLRLNQLKMLFLLLNVLVSCSLAIVCIVYICS